MPMTTQPLTSSRSIKMFTKIFFLKVSANASLLEHEQAAQDFVKAANNVFLKAQGLVTIASLHKMVLGLLEGLLDDWHMLGLETVEWRCKAELHSELSLQEQEEIYAYLANFSKPTSQACANQG
ncbi:hypothetical protein C0995_006960 [Termitomyces sp. Mi166|nr:hypothetical protein C0995_006960 [Termitomyces sp. Mi166\